MKLKNYSSYVPFKNIKHHIEMPKNQSRNKLLNLNTTNSSLITFNNPLNSSTLSDAETVDQIRENAPKIFSSQLRLVTESDYESNHNY